MPRIARDPNAGHPRLIELVRIANAISSGQAEIVTVVRDHAFVVASLGRNVLQPRTFLESEQRLVREDSTFIAAGQSSSFAAHSESGELIAMLTVVPAPAPETLEALRSVARLIADCFEQDETALTVEHDTALLGALRDPVLVVDSAFMIRYASSGVAALLGRTPKELRNRSAGDFVHTDDLHQAIEAFDRLAGGREAYRAVLRLRHGSGEYVRIEITGNDRLADQRIQGIVLSLRSGDHELELEHSLERERSLLSAILDQLHEGVVAIDPLGRPTVVNQAAKYLHGLARSSSPDGLTTHDLALFDADGRHVPPNDHPIPRVQAGEHISSQHFTLHAADGSLRHVLVSGRPVTNAKGEQIASVLAYHDSTEAQLTEGNLRDRAMHDPLTGVANRQQLRERMVKLAMGPAGTQLGVCFIDLDGFKLVNDTYGHAVGDEVLRTAARRLAAELRPSDLLARFGGDEFVALLTGAPDTFTALAIAERLRSTIARPFVVDGNIVTLSASMGVAMTPSKGMNEDVLLRSADVALYTAKAAGKNRVELFDDHLASATKDQHRQWEFLKSMLDSGGLSLHFQPAFEISSGRILGVEALARCLNANGEPVGPSAYMKAAVASGLVRELDRQAFALACKAAALLRDEYPDRIVPIACNFSSLSVAQPGFDEELLDVIQRFGLTTDRVCVEIAESTAIELSATARDALRGLTGQGVALILDDFGTGYGSLVHLRELPLIAVKLRHSFLTKLGEHSAEQVVAEAVVKLAETLTQIAVAEGIETEEQLEQAQAVGFRVAQGYHFAPPMSLPELVDLLRSSPYSPGSNPAIQRR
jgi:diguanylate cyclase (GGDEF)-like protein/PAS domain S-box-containing protein